MKAILPKFCRPLGYGMIGLALFLPFVMFLAGRVTDANLLLYKECVKLLMMIGAFMIFFAYTADENEEVSRLRGQAARNAILITIVFIFGTMIYRVYKHDFHAATSSTFLIYLLIQVLCWEFELNKRRINELFKKK